MTFPSMSTGSDPWTSIPVLVATRMGFSITVTSREVWYGRAPLSQPPTLDECILWLTRSRPGYYREVTIRWHHTPPVEAELWELRQEQRNNVRVKHGEQLALASGPTPLDAIYQLVLKVEVLS